MGTSCPDCACTDLAVGDGQFVIVYKCPCCGVSTRRTHIELTLEGIHTAGRSLAAGP